MPAEAATGCGVVGPRGDAASGLSSNNVLGGSGSAKGSALFSSTIPTNADWDETLLFFLRNKFLSLFLLDERLAGIPTAKSPSWGSLNDRGRPSDGVEYIELMLSCWLCRWYRFLDGPALSPFAFAMNTPSPTDFAFNFSTKPGPCSLFSSHRGSDFRFRKHMKSRVQSSARPATPPTTPPTIAPIFASPLLGIVSPLSGPVP
jgi:hypothetical protein